MFTFTFSESVENHVGMQQLGQRVPEGGGFQPEDLAEAQRRAQNAGIKTDLYDLNTNGLPPAQVLVMRQVFTDRAAIQSDLARLRPLFDTKALMRGRVVNKHARHNICITDDAQEPDYAAGRGRVVAFGDCPTLAKVRGWLPPVLGDKALDLFAEGNLYYDATCGIGFHGDTERRRVVGLRLTDLDTPFDMPIHWFHEGTPVGARIIVPLQPGDVYVMSEKAAGSDWKRRKIPTLRHATGHVKFTTIK